jgi:hypothetical protein
MRRSVLLTVAALGVLVSLFGGTVLFSALQDTARTGTNSAESAALPGAAPDIQLASATRTGTGPVVCGAYSDNLSSGLVSTTGLAPGSSLSADYFCIKNAGSKAVTLTAQAEELTDVDFACTGDEAANGDTTCGGDQLGELSSVLKIVYAPHDCQTGVFGSGNMSILKDSETTPTSLGDSLAAGATGCYSVEVWYPDTTAAAAAQKAQSDRATWRFKFTAQA